MIIKGKICEILVNLTNLNSIRIIFSIKNIMDNGEIQMSFARNDSPMFTFFRSPRCPLIKVEKAETVIEKANKILDKLHQYATSMQSKPHVTHKDNFDKAEASCTAKVDICTSGLTPPQFFAASELIEMSIKKFIPDPRIIVSVQTNAERMRVTARYKLIAQSKLPAAIGLICFNEVKETMKSLVKDMFSEWKTHPTDSTLVQRQCNDASHFDTIVNYLKVMKNIYSELEIKKDFDIVRRDEKYTLSVKKDSIEDAKQLIGSPVPTPLNNLGM